MLLNKTLKIFLVDEDSFCLAMYQQCLSNLGCKNITVFNSGKDCIDNLYKQPDLIFTAGDLSTHTGLQMLKNIKHFNADIYAILISSDEDTTLITEALKCGAFEYIIKGQNEMEKIQEVVLKILKNEKFLSLNAGSYSR